MTTRRLLLRSLRFHVREHLGVLLGATVAAAVLLGALAVGDSVRGSLRERALARLASFHVALRSPDRFFTQQLATRLAERANLNAPAPRVPSTRPMPAAYSALLELPANIARQDGAARVNRIAVYGLDSSSYWPLQRTSPGRSLASDQVWLSDALAIQLGVRPGDELVVRLHKPSALSRDAVITPRDETSVALRLRFAGVLEAAAGGDLGLDSRQASPMNAFVDRQRLSTAVGLSDRANLLLGLDPSSESSAPTSQEKASGWAFAPLRQDGQPASDALLEAQSQELLRANWTLADAELSLRIHPATVNPTGDDTAASGIDLATSRIFLDPVITAAVDRVSISNAQTAPILTYLVNSLATDAGLAPYSMVTAAGPPWTPSDLADDEILINEWLAEDLRLKAGDRVSLRYYRADSAAALVEQTNMFRVRGIVPLRGVHADRTLMPEFPGLSKAESTHDWDAGFDLVHKIREKDEAYWKQWRGTPKAFVNLRTGQKMWANRFGELTAIRWLLPPGERSTNDLTALRNAIETRLRASLDPADVGLRFEGIRDRALTGATSGQDFGGLFIGFSFFLIVSALLLTALLFRFGLEQRASELGTLLAVGWSPGRVKRLFLREGLALAALGSVLGAAGGVFYGRAVIWGLNTIWRDAVAGAGLQFHVSTITWVGGTAASIAVTGVALWRALRSAAQRPARELLNEGASERGWNLQSGRTRPWAPMVATALAVGLLGAGWGVPDSQRAGLFFGAGALLLTAGLLWLRIWLRRSLANGLGAATNRTALALRAAARQPTRSLATVALLASATFLIVSVGANKLDATRDAHQRGSGTGGFTFWGEAALPIVQDLNTAKGQEQNGLDPKRMAAAGVRVVALRVRDGDEASCLNLNRAQRPRLLGVNPSELATRRAFTFTGLAKGIPATNGWDALRTPLVTVEPGATPPQTAITEVPAIGDANSIQWALGKKLGDTLEYVDELGRPFRVRLVGAVANSILQGNLLIDEAEFVKRFPSESGRRAFLIDAAAPAGSAPGTIPAAVAAELSRALQDFGLELVPAPVRLAQFNAVQNTYLNTFQVLGGLGLLLGSFGLGVVVLRNVFERRGELAVMQAVGFEPRVLERLVLLEHSALLVIGLALGATASLLAVLPALVAPGGSGVPWVSLAAVLALVLANGVVWTWLATRRALRGELLPALRGE